MKPEDGESNGRDEGAHTRELTCPAHVCILRSTQLSFSQPFAFCFRLLLPPRFTHNAMHRGGYSLPAGPNRSMFIVLLVMMGSIYGWVSQQDGPARYGSKLGVQQQAQRVLILQPQSIIGHGAADSLARAGHRVYALLDPVDSSSPAQAALEAHFRASEVEPLFFTGSRSNVSSLVDLVVSNGINLIFDLNPIIHASDANHLELVRRLSKLKVTPAVGKRTYVYLSPCTMHALEREPPAAMPVSAASVAAAEAARKEGSAADFPAHVDLYSHDFEQELRTIGMGKSYSLHTIVLRPGVLYGSDAWQSSPLRSWFAVEPPPLPASVSSKIFLGVHLNDLLGAFAAIGSTSAPGLQALSGDEYDILDESRLTFGEVHSMLQTAASSKTLPPLPPPPKGSKELVAGNIITADSDLAPPTDGEPKKIAQAEVDAGAVPTAVSGPKPAASKHALRKILSTGEPDASASATAADDALSLWHSRPRCLNPSKSLQLKFQQLTHWRPAHRKVNDATMMHTYVQAIRQHAADEAAARKAL